MNEIIASYLAGSLEDFFINDKCTDEKSPAFSHQGKFMKILNITKEGITISSTWGIFAVVIKWEHVDIEKTKKLIKFRDKNTSNVRCVIPCELYREVK